MDENGSSPGTGRRIGRRIAGGHGESTDDIIAEEVPVGFVYNGLAHAVMMATPENLSDFAYGFSFSESIVEDAGDIFAVDEKSAEFGRELAITLAAARFTAFRGRRRGIVGRSGCGLCGIEQLDELRPAAGRVAVPARIGAPVLAAAVARLPSLQIMNAACGGLHAAAFFRTDGTAVAAREDVGRHNALDKLIGALLLSGEPRDAGFAVLSSRASYEMVDKAVRAGIPVLASVSAPTTLAVDRAAAAGLTLVSFARGDRFTIYSEPDRIIL